MAPQCQINKVDFLFRNVLKQFREGEQVIKFSIEVFDSMTTDELALLQYRYKLHFVDSNPVFANKSWNDQAILCCKSMFDDNMSLIRPGCKPKIRRPLNAFILYRRDHHHEIKALHPNMHNNDLSVIIGCMWQHESEAVTEHYRGMAEQLKFEHMKKYPGYLYKPRKSSQKKRRMTKKKAEKLAAEIGADEPFAGFPEEIAPNFNELLGAWTTDRVAALPSTVFLPDLVEHHNMQQSNEVLGETSVEILSSFNTLQKGDIAQLSASYIHPGIDEAQLFWSRPIHE